MVGEKSAKFNSLHGIIHACAGSLNTIETRDIKSVHCPSQKTVYI